MALPVYPIELPRPLRDGYQFGLGDGRFKSQNDAGPYNMRGRYSTSPNTVAFSSLLDRTQLGRFEWFFNEATRKGALPFLIPDPASDLYCWLDEDGVPMLDEDGVPILTTETWLVMFDQQPTFTPRDICWTVSFSLTVLP